MHRSNSEIILDMKNLVVDYETDDGIVHAVNGMNIKLNRKQSLGIVGETGAGKTTTALSILRLIPDPPGVIKNGEIFLEGEDILLYPEAKMRKLRGSYVSMIFQDPMTSLNPVLTVGEQISEVIRVHRKADSEDVIRKAKEMLEVVGIKSDRYNDFPYQFSGGMKQRIVIAMALACYPKLLIADEPTTALDVTIQAQILEVMKDLKEKFDTSLILITHDLGVVAEICDIVSVVYAGSIIEHGTLRDIFKSTKHPYTEGLFNSLPNINARAEFLKPIPGSMPDPTQVYTGCAFYERCKYAVDKCNAVKPPKIWLNDTHYVVCHKYDDIELTQKEVENNGM
ncbi:MAG: ABC transporter ATP-binding protein [Firmicutes bacterium]|nr:ABC transporter ATP-binding protein [Bacillota bacterium]